MLQPLDKPSPWRYAVWPIIVLLLLGAGFCFGVWFSNRYRIVPVDPANINTESGTLASTDVSPSAVPSYSAENPPSTQEYSSDGPFQFRFTPEEVTYYRLDTTIAGQGADGGLASDVYLDFDGDFSLYTKDVDDRGVADLRLLFESASLNGEFLGSPFEMGYSPERTYIYDGGQTLDTDAGANVGDIPQLQFFQHPLTMRVAPNGQVLDIGGQTGMAGMLKALPALARVEFPDEGVPESGQWESRIQMPVPGFGQAVDTRIVNKLIGYEYVGDRYCAVIHQNVGAAQQDGTLDSPESAMGSAMQFTMPLFDLNGTNTVYFDVNRGQVVHAVLDLALIMNIGSVLGDAAGIVGQLGQGILGGNAEGVEDLLGPAPNQPNLLDLSVKIDGAISAFDPAAEPVPVP
ncbi:MAG: hypothetical protein KJ060_12970 [Candidatus Hydrogenedentes bacterium]|nr:hypothetical protein [Candidatus Hydrogenedentota bacterium]